MNHFLNLGRLSKKDGMNSFIVTHIFFSDNDKLHDLLLKMTKRNMIGEYFQNYELDIHIKTEKEIILFFLYHSFSTLKVELI